MKRATKVHAHDENNTAAIGDMVTVKECRPISKNKTWVLIEEGSEIISNDAEVTKEGE